MLDRIRCAALAGGDVSITSDHTVLRGDGCSLPVRVRAQRLPLAEPALEEGLIWLIVEDLRESLAAEAGLRQAASVFRDAQEGIMITEPDGRIVDVNGAFSRITGYGREEVLGANPRLLKSGHHDTAFYARMWRLLNEQGTWSGEVVNRARDGSTLEVLETISAVKDDSGCVSHYVALLTDIRQLKKQQHQLERLAHFDPLTGLPNRILLARRLEEAMAMALQCGHPIAIGYLDLDGFKEVNDSLGHAAGDHLLQVLATRMEAALRPEDLLARLGGDEFVLVLGSLPASGERLPILDQVLSSLEEPVAWNGVPMRVTASIGVTFFPQDAQGLGPDQLLRHADQAMYDAKRLGRNRYALFQAPGDPDG
jgi:diguanylate cyclase (GGDEF)-like protein/PAS domain S-box-containing protein